jgi:hypothetical protein
MKLEVRHEHQIILPRDLDGLAGSRKVCAANNCMISFHNVTSVFLVHFDID